MPRRWCPRSPGALPTRLVIAPVRGYQTAAERAGQLLTESGEFAPSRHPVLESVLEATGQRPGGAADIGEITLSPSMPAQAALAGVLLQLADTITANVSFVIADVDTEFLHDLRVAVRRTRSALKLAGDALPGGMAARYAARVQVAGRPHHPDSRPGCLPDRLRPDGRRAERRLAR